MRYEKVLAIVGVMACISLNAGVTFLLSLFLIGIPFLFAATAFVYLLALYPAVRAKRSNRPPWAIALLLFSGIAGVAFGVPILAHARYAIAERAVQTRDFEKPFKMYPGEVSIFLRADAPNRWAPRYDANCWELCQALLHIASINTVYVTDEKRSVAYTMKDKRCELDEPPSHGLRMRHAIGYCYDSQTLTSAPSTPLTITATYLSKDKTEDWSFKPWWLRDIFKIEVTANAEAVAKKTFIDGEVGSVPLFFDYHFSQGTPDNLRIHRIALPTWQERTVDVVARLMKKS